MNLSLLLFDYKVELECEYKGERYSVRDNGSVLRHPKNNKNPRPTDNVWTFGKYDDKTGYAKIAGESVHRIVATAFHGTAPSSQHVVDHIDTNRRNNRPENLRWITKLENILLNPGTVKKIEIACGSVEVFLKNPGILRQGYLDKDFEWMRAVTKEEAAATSERMLDWAKNDNHTYGGSLGEWIYKSRSKKKIEQDIIFDASTNEKANNDSDQSSNAVQAIEKKTRKSKSRSNPFDFPRPNDLEDNVTMYRTNGELYGLLKTLLELDKTIKLPDIILPTAGKGIVIKESWEQKIENIEFSYTWKARVPKSIILHCENQSVAILLKKAGSNNNEEIANLIEKGYNITEIDVSRAKDGVTDAEMKHLLQTDVSKKKWIHHEKIIEARKRLEKICEPRFNSGEGVLHSYFACPRISDNVQDIDCWYCDYNISNEPFAGAESCCFGKSGVQTYQDLLSITNVEKEDGRIVGITYFKDGENIIKRFDENAYVQGKTLFQLWEERTGEVLIAHNINSGWIVLIVEDPKACYDKKGCVYGKLSKNIQGLRTHQTSQIFNADRPCWKIINW